MSTVKDMISVIIPVYNRETFIEECIASVLTQSYPHFEIIIIDDGSSDNTFKLCQKLAEQDSRIKLLSTDHCGVSAARNTGLAQAEGEFIFFLDSDDVISPLLFETLVDGMNMNDVSIAGTCVVAVSENQWESVRSKLTETLSKGNLLYQNNEASLYAMFHTDSPLGCIGGVMLRRGLIGETKFRTDIHIGEDFFFIYENLIKGASCAFLKERWYYVRKHAGNSSWDYSFNGFWTRFYRRKLVWKSEESFGRNRYAIRQKRSAFSCFIRCIKNNKPYSEDGRKMRFVIKEHKKDIFSSLTHKEKLLYLIYVYFPLVAKLFNKREK